MRTVFWSYCGLAAAGAAAYPFVPAPIQDALYLSASIAVVIAVCWGIRKNRPSSKAPWILLALGLTCSLSGDLGTNVFHYIFRAQVAFPSLLDGIYLLFYPMLFVAIGRFLQASGNPDRAAWVDASIWTIGVAGLLWEPLIRPYVVVADTSFAGYVVALAYPMLDLGLLLMVLRMLAGRASLHPAAVLLTSALMVEVVIDFIYTVRELQGTYVPGELTDVGWMLVNLLLGAAALHPSMVRLTQPLSRPARLPSPRRLQALLVPALVVPAVLLYQLVSDGTGVDLSDGIFGGVAIALLLVLVVMRGGGLLRVAEQRSNQLTERTAALEFALDDRERVSRQLQSRVNEDMLTGLASRDRFVEALQADVAAWHAGGSLPSVAFLDLDDFKSINDSMGHEAGDLLLIEIARRMRTALGQGPLVARLGGDEFAVILHGDADRTAATLVDVLRVPVLIHGRALRPQVSVGVTTARSPRCTSSDLLREADVAMYAAKRAGGGWARYQVGMSAVLLERIDLRNRLVHALQMGEIQPWFQPVVNLASGALLGFEALARWCPPGSAVLAPHQWLPFAEESGLVVEVDRAILQAAVAQLAAWLSEVPGSNLELAVNFSGRTLQQPGIEAEVLEALRRHGVPPHLLTVEVTEGVLIDDDQVSERLQLLRAEGVRIALDDFGTGWSSLSYLRRFPVDQLKLDRSFTDDLGRNPEADAIPAAIVQLGNGLSLDAVAEGVETLEQCHRLIALGFRVGQGYLFGRAQRAADLTARVRQSRPQLALVREQSPAATLLHAVR